MKYSGIDLHSNNSVVQALTARGVFALHTQGAS